MVEQITRIAPNPRWVDMKGSAESIIDAINRQGSRLFKLYDWQMAH
jgi:hypothetical protein